MATRKLPPVAAATEVGIEIENVAESGLVDYQQLVSFGQLLEEVQSE